METKQHEAGVTCCGTVKEVLPLLLLGPLTHVSTTYTSHGPMSSSRTRQHNQFMLDVLCAFCALLLNDLADVELFILGTL